MAALRTIVALVVTLHGVSARASDGDQAATDSGADITRPTHRIDLRAELESDDGERTRKLTLRYAHPVFLENRWRVNLQVDLPFASRSLSGQAADEDAQTRGDGDVILQAILARETDGSRAFGFGTQLILPTASQEASGKGKWRLRPAVGYRWSLPGSSGRSFFQLLVRYDFSFAGDKSRPRVSELQFSPNLELGLSRSAYVSIFSSPDIRYNFVTDELFVPINVEFGKSIGRRLIVSLELGKSVIGGEHQPYDWKAEGRVGFRF